MTCDGYQELISTMFDGELEDHHVPSLFQHLGTCEQCRQFFQAGLKLRSAFAIAKPMITPRGLDERIERIAFGKRSMVSRSVVETLWSTKIAFPLPAAASIAILLIIGSLLLLPAVLEEPKASITISSEMLYKAPSSLLPDLQTQSAQEENRGR